MRLLLDTHAFIWWVEQDDQLSRRAREAILGAPNDVYVSAVTGLEIATKVRTRKLKFDVRRLEHFEDTVRELGFQGMGVTLAHGCRAGLLPGEHRDPFDRILAAQCEIESAALVTKDRAFAAFGTPMLW